MSDLEVSPDERGCGTYSCEFYVSQLPFREKEAPGNLKSGILFDFISHKRVYSFVSIRIKLQMGIEMDFLKIDYRSGVKGQKNK